MGSPNCRSEVGATRHQDNKVRVGMRSNGDFVAETAVQGILIVAQLLRRLWLFIQPCEAIRFSVGKEATAAPKA